MKGRVLIIDQDREYSERLRDELRVLGYEVLAASNSKSGIEVAQAFSPSVIITDTFSVGPDSLSALKELRTNQPQTPVIIAGDQSSIETAVRAIQEEGAFTGAVSRRHGCFELANTGTLLLDEIGEMPSLLQAKLLRVIEERVVHRLGSRKDIPVDVRILAATNKDPQTAVADGSLREDLLYRLNVITIHMPPLTERMDDLPLLTQHLVTRLAAKHSRPARFISPAALDALRFHSWPGNVRELRNVVERAVVICSGEQIERHHFAPYPFDQRQRQRAEDTVTFPVGTPLEEIERQMILRTLDKTGNNKTKAADLLEISLKTLHNKLNSYRARGLLHDK